MAASLAALVLALAREREPNAQRPRDPVQVGEIVVRSGEVTVTGASGATGAIATATTIATGRDGRAALELAAGASLRIDVATRVRFESPTRMALDRGAVYLDVGPGSTGAPLVVETPLGTVWHLGTQFEVRLQAGGRGEKPGALRVSVREGKVSVEQRGLVSEAGAGSELILRTDGSIARGVTAAAGSAFDWIQQVAPEYPIEGRTLASYLAWVRRETGLPVHFADAELEAQSDRTALHGTIAGLTPEESLAVVLPGCGLRHVREGAAIRIASAEAP